MVQPWHGLQYCYARDQDVAAWQGRRGAYLSGTGPRTGSLTGYLVLIARLCVSTGSFKDYRTGADEEMSHSLLDFKQMVK